MNWVDAVVLVVIAFSGLLGFTRGLVREALGLGAWVGAIFAARYGFDTFRPIAARWIADPDVASAVTFGALFLIALVVLSVFASAIGQAVRTSRIGGLDRTLGLAFGLARGAVLIIAAYIIAGWVLPVDRWPPAVLEARTLPLAWHGAEWVTGQLPPHLRPPVYAPPGAASPSAADLLQANPTGRATRPPR